MPRIGYLAFTVCLQTLQLQTQIFTSHEPCESPPPGAHRMMEQRIEAFAEGLNESDPANCGLTLRSLLSEAALRCAFRKLKPTHRVPTSAGRFEPLRSMHSSAVHLEFLAAPCISLGKLPAHATLNPSRTASSATDPKTLVYIMMTPGKTPASEGVCSTARTSTKIKILRTKSAL
jgi:hypothetical protein